MIFSPPLRLNHGSAFAHRPLAVKKPVNCRIAEAIEKLAVDPDKLCKTTKAEEPRKQPAKVIVSLDVEEFGPIELEVRWFLGNEYT